MYFNVFNKDRKSKKTKISYIFFKTWSFSIVYSKCDHEYEKIFKEEESVEILKILGLINDIEKYHNKYIIWNWTTLELVTIYNSL